MKKFRASEAIKIIKDTPEYKLLVQDFAYFSSVSLSKGARSLNERVKRRLKAVLKIGREIIPFLRNRILETEKDLFEKMISEELPYFISIWQSIEAGYIYF